MNLLDISKQCLNGIFCEKQQCKKKHYRCFTGLCVQELLDCGSCINYQCKLVHYTKNEYRSELNIQPINGIYRFNICRNKKCEQNGCLFLHPEWAKDYCIDFVMDECDDTNHTSHAYWNDMREGIYQKYQKQLKIKGNPEQNLEYIQIYLVESERICINNLKGLCKNKAEHCSKHHIFWESVKNRVSFINEKCLSCVESYEQQRSSLKWQENKEVQKIKDKIQMHNIIDIIFVLDFTESKKKFIQGFLETKQGLDKFFAKQQYMIRIGVIGYSYHQTDQQLEYHELTSDILKVINYVSKQKLTTDEGKAKDICLGLEKAMTQNFSKRPNDILITILFGDAPCHGEQYHDNNVNDSLADQVPVNQLENLMKRYYNMKHNNFFTCVGITSVTKQMFEIMKQNFPGLIISQCVEKFLDFCNLIESTINNSCQITQQLKNKEIQFEANFQKPNLLFWDYQNLKTQEKNLFWKQFQDLTKCGETFLHFFDKDVISAEEEQGVNAQIYKFHDVANNLWIIIKIPKNIVELNEKNLQVSRQEIQQAEEDVEIRYENQARAMWLAYIFRKKTLHIVGAPPIFFPLPILYTLKNQTFKGLSKIYGEVYIDIPQLKWKKYSNNGIYLDNQYYFYTAFSHFVLEETQRWFTFTDLQGKRNLLSDPAIQTSQNYLDKSISDKQNLREIGIGSFLIQHSQCSYICQELGLNKQADETNLNCQKWVTQREDQKIDIFCEICDIQAEITHKQYKDAQICLECRENIYQAEQHFCECCRNRYSSSFGSFNFKRCICCKSCFNQCKNNGCVYCDMSCSRNLIECTINGKQVLICYQGVQYLYSLNCCICKANYNFTTQLNRDEYQKGMYCCEREYCQNSKR